MKDQLSSSLSRYMSENEFSQVDAAEHLGVSQSIISRVINGSWQRESHHIKLIAEKLGVRKSVDPKSSPLLMSALQEAWDGDEESERLLAEAIRSLGRLAQKRNFK